MVSSLRRLHPCPAFRRRLRGHVFTIGLLCLLIFVLARSTSVFHFFSTNEAADVDWNRLRPNGTIVEQAHAVVARADVNVVCPNLQSVSREFISVTSCLNSAKCPLNSANHTPPIVSRTSRDHCGSVIKCVTVCLKTAGRHDHIVRLVQSAWKYYPGLRFVVVDDAHATSDISPSFRQLIGETHLIRYIQLNESNAGLAKGRNAALQAATTEYILFSDDDFVFWNDTILEFPLAILINTDSSLVGGQVGRCSFFGLFKFHQQLSSSPNQSLHTSLHHYEYLVTEPVPGYATCYATDIVQNFFVARRCDLLQIGGWNDQLQVSEHEDLFLRLKVARKKVAFCPQFTIDHHAVNDRYRSHREYVWATYRQVLLNLWQLDDIKRCYLLAVSRGGKPYFQCTIL